METCEHCGFPSRGHKLNRWASLGMQIVNLKELIPKLEKQARKTPPRNLLAEKAKVEKAKEQLLKLRPQLEAAEVERVTLNQELWG